MTAKGVPPQAININQTIASSTTCTSATVSELKSLLFPDRPIKTIHSTKSIATAHISTSQLAAPVRGGRVRARKQPDVTILESPEDVSSPNCSPDRQRLATEVINTVLNALTEAIKSQSLAQGPGKKRSSPKKDSHTQNPLQPICANQVVNDKDQRRTLQQSKCPGGVKAASGPLAQAECARLALAALRASNARTTPEKRLPFLRLEKATSTLISKLLALELFEPALRELCILKKSLLAASAESSMVEIMPYEHVASKEKIADLLVLPCTNFKSPVLAMMVTFQLQVVRLIAAKRDPSLFRAVIEHLQLQTPYSPANMINAQYDPTDLQASKRIAGQLESLSQMISSMCPGSSSADEHHSDSTRSMDPLTGFRFQLLALELRSSWWRITGHDGNVVKELLEPFGRYLSAFRRRCLTGNVDGYLMANKFLTNLTSPSQCANRSLSTSIAGHEAWRLIYSEMVEIARRTTLPQETNKWIGDYMELPIDAGISACQKCIITCKRAITCAQIPDDTSSEVQKTKALEDAEQHIEGDLNGASEELDELLLTVAKLRKTAASIINTTRTRLDKHERLPSSDLVQQCFRICSTSVRFLGRYIGVKPTQSARHQSAQRYEQRVEQASAVARAFIDSMVSIAKLSKGDDSDHWVRLEAGLRECLKLANTTQGSCQATIKNRTNANITSSVYASVSDAYWTRYVHLKQSSTDSKGSLRALEGCISAVEHRPLMDKLAAQLHTRLEHYARGLETARDYSGAAKCYMKAIKLHVEASFLQEAVNAAATQPLARLFTKGSDFALLGRVLAAYPRLATKAGLGMTPSETVFDDERLESSQRGIALEHQLATLCSQTLSSTIVPRAHAAIRCLATKLLTVYSEQSFPIRRLRVVEMLMWLRSARPEVLLPQIIDEAVDLKIDLFFDNLLGPDLGLQHMLPHLGASRDAVLAIEAGCPTLKKQKLKSALATWRQLIEQCSDWRSLETRVGDVPTWLLHLEFLADYLDVHGLSQQRLSTLQLCIVVREKIFPTHHEALTLILAQSGLQQLRLGYSHQAGLEFHKAQKLISEVEGSDETAANFYIAYATYCFAIGNIGKCEDNLAHARKVFESNGQEGQALFAHDRIRLLQFMADVTALCSNLAARRGDFAKALLFAHQGLGSAQQAWAITERLYRKARTNDVEKDDSVEMERLTDSMSTATIQDVGKGSTINGRASVFWCLVPRLHRAFLQVAQLYENAGLFNEAKYYLERSQKSAEAASAPGLLCQSLSRLADLLTRSEDYAAANSTFELADKQFGALEGDQQYAAFQINLANYHLAQAQDQAAGRACGIAESALQRLAAPEYADDILSRGPSIEASQEQLSGLTIPEIPTLPSTTKKRNSVKRSTSKTIPSSKGTLVCRADPQAPSSALDCLRREALRQRASLAVREGKLDQASEFLAQATSQYCTAHETVLHAILGAEISIKRGLNVISSDPVFCVLPESTVSLPSVLPRGPAELPDVPENPLVTTRQKTVKRGPVVTRGTKTRASPKPSSGNLCDGFRQAHLATHKVCQLANIVCPTASLHHLTKVMAETLLSYRRLICLSPRKLFTQVLHLFYILPVWYTAFLLIDRC